MANVKVSAHKQIDKPKGKKRCIDGGVGWVRESKKLFKFKRRSNGFE